MQQKHEEGNTTYLQRNMTMNQDRTEGWGELNTQRLMTGNRLQVSDEWGESVVCNECGSPEDGAVRLWVSVVKWVDDVGAECPKSSVTRVSRIWVGRPGGGEREQGKSGMLQNVLDKKVWHVIFLLVRVFRVIKMQIDVDPLRRSHKVIKQDIIASRPTV